MAEFVYFITALFVGGIITWIVSRYYYIQAGKDLEKEVSELVKKINFLLRGMEEAGHIRWNRDKQGNVIGIVLLASGSAHIKIGASGNLTKKPKDDIPPKQ